MKEKWLNRIAVVGFIVVLGLLVWWLFRPQHMPFTLLARWKVQGFVADDIVLSPDGDWLAASVFDFQKGQSTLTVQLWQVSKAQTNPKVLIVSQQVEPKHPSLPRRLDFSPDGHLLAVGYLEQGVGKVALFTFPDGHRLKTITMGKSISPPFVTFAPNGRLAVVQHFESYSQLWFVRVDGGKEMPIKLQAQIPALAEGIAFSPDGHWMVVLQGGTARLYDAKGHFVRQIQSTPPLVRTAVFSKDGQRFACLQYSESALWLPQRKLPISYLRYGISVWQTSDWRLVRSAPLTPFYEVLFFSPFAVFSPDLSMVALSEPDLRGWAGMLWRLERFFVRLLDLPFPIELPNQVVVRRLSDGQIVAKLPRFGLYVWDCVFSPDGRYLAVSHGNTIALWERKGD